MPTVINLHDIGPLLHRHFPEIKKLYLFGSRRHQTMSTRSDIDILVESDSPLIPYKIIEFISKHCPPLDLFLIEGSIARSCKNQSYIQGDNLIQKLDALLFWDRGTGTTTPIGVNPLFEVESNADFRGTVALGGYTGSGPAWQKMLAMAERNKLPTSPFIGADIHQATKFIINLCQELKFTDEKLSGRGGARGTWLTRPSSEYHWQDLMYLALKPWLPGLSREETTIRYDGQEKSADFHIFRDTLVVEVKFAKDANTKAAVLKTLSGLSDLYSANINVKVILFVIFATQDARIDGGKWAADFSRTTNHPMVLVSVIQV